jgi:hypothetical protein
VGVLVWLKKFTPVSWIPPLTLILSQREKGLQDRAVFRNYLPLSAHKGEEISVKFSP